MATIGNPIVVGGSGTAEFDVLYSNSTPGISDSQTCSIKSSTYKMFRITLQAYTGVRNEKNVVYVSYDQLVSGVLVGVVWVSVNQSRVRRAKFNSAKTAVIFNQWTDPYNGACCLCEKIEGIKNWEM